MPKATRAEELVFCSSEDFLLFLLAFWALLRFPGPTFFSELCFLFWPPCFPTLHLPGLADIRAFLLTAKQSHTQYFEKWQIKPNGHSVAVLRVTES